MFPLLLETYSDYTTTVYPTLSQLHYRNDDNAFFGFKYTVLQSCILGLESNELKLWWFLLMKTEVMYK